MKYIRRINSINHWDVRQMDLYKGSFSTGDILFSELKTDKNTLSLWSYQDDQEISDLLVAIALGRDSIQKLVYVIMDDEGIEKMGIPCKPERGDADGLKSENILMKHVNLTNIDFWRLGYVAEYLCELTQNNATHSCITENELFKLIRSRVEGGMVIVDEMNEKMRLSYQRHLEKEQAKETKKK